MKNVKAPDFFKNGYLVITDEGYELKPDAPPDVVKEFNDFVKDYEENEKEGVFI